MSSIVVNLVPIDPLTVVNEPLIADFLPAEPVNALILAICAYCDPVAAIKLVTSPSNAVALLVFVVTLPAIEELKAVDDPDIIASDTSIVISFALTAVVIGPAPENVNVSSEAIASSVPLSAPTLNVVPVSYTHLTLPTKRIV